MVTIYGGGVEEYVTATAASRILDVSVDTVRRWSKLGLIKANRGSRGEGQFRIEELVRLQKKLDGDCDSHEYGVLGDGTVFSDVTCVDLFAGAGGTALGFANAGLHHTYLNEFDRYAVQTLRVNSEKHGLDWNIDDSDVRLVDFEGMKAEVIQAGFPCQAFSYAGKSRGFEETRGTLFFEFARAIKSIRPTIAVGENVRGLVRHDSGRTLETMIKTLDIGSPIVCSGHSI